MNNSAVSPNISSDHDLTIYADKSDPGAPYILLPTTDGGYEIDLPIDAWAPKWASITVELTSQSTMMQVPDPPYSVYELFRARYQIDQAYECTNPETEEVQSWIISSFTMNPESPTRCEPGTGEISAMCYAGKGVNSLFYKSKPIEVCNGCTISDGDFQPAVDMTSHVSPQSSGVTCLCATGGTGDYLYDILEGQLASGLTLNHETGCIEGEADGLQPGTPDITFQASDRGGGGNTVGDTVTIGGTCYLDGSHVIWASGALFSAEMVGHTFVVNGVNRTVASFQNQYNITLV